MSVSEKNAFTHSASGECEMMKKEKRINDVPFENVISWERYTMIRGEVSP